MNPSVPSSRSSRKSRRRPPKPKLAPVSAPEPAQPPLLQLDGDFLLRIAKHASTPDVINLSLTCKTLQNIFGPILSALTAYTVAPHLLRAICLRHYNATNCLLKYHFANNDINEPLGEDRVLYIAQMLSLKLHRAQTLLHLAAAMGDFTIVKTLVFWGARVNHTGHGASPLDLAAKANSKECVAYLLYKRATPAKGKVDGYVCYDKIWWRAVDRGWGEVIRRLYFSMQLRNAIRGIQRVLRRVLDEEEKENWREILRFLVRDRGIIKAYLEKFEGVREDVKEQNRRLEEVREAMLRAGSEYSEDTWKLTEVRGEKDVKGKGKEVVWI